MGCAQSLIQLRRAAQEACPVVAGLTTTAIICVVNIFAGHHIEDSSKYTLLLIPVAVGAGFGGAVPGLTALLTSLLAAHYFFADPKYTLVVKDFGDLVSLGLYAAVGAAIIYFGERLHRDRVRIRESEAATKDMCARLEVMNETLEARVAERTEELETSHRLMESFCYSVAHDLRSALIGISSNAGIALEDHGQKLDADGRRTLERLLQASQRLSGVVDALLMHARLGQKPLARRRLDLTALAQDMASRLSEQRWSSRDLEFRIQSDMGVEGDLALIGILLFGLMENACKFAQPGEPQVVEVFQQPDGAVTVRDNGMGFEPAYMEKLFRPFEKLHPDTPGVGIGLANCARIVQLHGGRIWAEGAPGQGCAISFHLSEAVKSLPVRSRMVL